ncbi:hypothetical protein ACFQE1_14260 [Halobium palmae]|uniref:DUF7351 domain-containing protein n=1 Tax=Halobium palmae TaxID=1776492 RepID=A0ABD5S1T4_9EURY
MHTERSELPLAFERYVNSLLDRARGGVCPSCPGRVEPTLRLDAEGIPHADPDEVPLVLYECHRCPELVSTSVGKAAIDHPGVVVFHHERGVDLRSAPSWTLGWVLADPDAESTDPVRVRPTVELDGDALELVLDRGAAVVETVPSGD